jgi:hypothetical protein
VHAVLHGQIRRVAPLHETDGLAGIHILNPHRGSRTRAAMKPRTTKLRAISARIMLQHQ